LFQEDLVKVLLLFLAMLLELETVLNIHSPSYMHN